MTDKSELLGGYEIHEMKHNKNTNDGEKMYNL